MNVPPETLDSWAATCHRLHGSLHPVADHLRRTDAPADVQGVLEDTRGRLWRLMKALVRAGADDPHAKAQAERQEARRAAGHAVAEPKPVPVELLSSPAARRYAAAMRAAAEACAAMEKERGLSDGMAEMLADFAAGAEFEVYGPAGLPGLE